MIGGVYQPPSHEGWQHSLRGSCGGGQSVCGSALSRSVGPSLSDLYGTHRDLYFANIILNRANRALRDHSADDSGIGDVHGYLRDVPAPPPCRVVTKSSDRWF